MNIQCYDNAVKETNSRIWVPAKCLYTKTIPFKKYYIILKRFNKDTNEYDYYIWFTDNQDIDPKYNKQLTNKTNRGTVYVHLNQIWNELNLNTYVENLYVKLELEEKDEDDTSEIYKLVLV